LRLVKGQMVRARNEQNEVAGVVIFASPQDSNPQSIMIGFTEATGIRCEDGGIAVTPVLALSIDYERETVEDLRGAEWEIDVADERVTYDDPE
jgi:hypothetical protein